MEENQVPNPEQFNVSGNQPKKKKTGPIKGLFIALLIVFLICVIGLLVRMVVAGDGDYFKPIKDIFGIEGEKEKDDKKSSNTSSSNGKTEVKSGARYALLSDDTKGKNVKHYRLTVDMKDIMEKALEEMSTVNGAYNGDYDNGYTIDDYDNDYSYYDYDNDYSYYDYDDDDYSSDYSSSNSFSDNLESMMGIGMMFVQQLSDLIAGEMYIDVYFEGNEIVQIIFGYDYTDFAKNMYDYVLDLDEDSLEDEGIESFEDFLDYMNDQFKDMLNEDDLYDAIMESADEDTEATLSAMGIKEKDIKDAVDFYSDNGIFEVYFNGTTKMKAIISMALESDSFKDELEALEDESNVKIDEDNIIESVLKAANKDDEYADLGLEFVEVK